MLPSLTALNIDTPKKRRLLIEPLAEPVVEWHSDLVTPILQSMRQVILMDNVFSSAVIDQFIEAAGVQRLIQSLSGIRDLTVPQALAKLEEVTVAETGVSSITPRGGGDESGIHTDKLDLKFGSQWAINTPLLEPLRTAIHKAKTLMTQQTRLDVHTYWHLMLTWPGSKSQPPHADQSRVNANEYITIAVPLITPLNSGATVFPMDEEGTPFTSAEPIYSNSLQVSTPGSIAAFNGHVTHYGDANRYAVAEGGEGSDGGVRAFLYIAVTTEAKDSNAPLEM